MTVSVEQENPDAITDQSWLRARGIGWWDFAVLCTIGLLIIAFVPPLMFDGWTPRFVIVLAVGPMGLYALTRLCISRDRSAVLIALATGWTVIAALFTGQIRSALIGTVGRDLSALVIALSAGIWAMGRFAGPAARARAPGVVVWATTLSAAVGILQVLMSVDTGPLAMVGGRPFAFATNPVYFGATCAAGLIVATHQSCGGPWARHAVPVVVMGIATTLSGSRVALATALLLLIALVATRRTIRAFAAACGALLALAVGVLIDRVAGAGRNAVDRLSSGQDGRTQVWKYGWEAVTERPVAGWGFGRFRPAVQGRFSVPFVRDYAPSELTQAWFDAHNVVVGVAVAGGLTAVLLFGTWAIVVSMRIRGPLVWALAAIVLHWMLQPVSLVTLPLAMLLAGVADRAVVSRATMSHRLVYFTSALGVTLALTAFTGDVLLRLAANDLDGERAAGVVRIYLGDPVAQDIVAQIYAAEALNDPQAGWDEVVDWRERVALAEPDRPYWWTELAGAQINAQQYEEAANSIQRAYALQENNIRTLRTEANLAIATGNRDRLDEILERLCDYDQPECGATSAELLGE